MKISRVVVVSQLASHLSHLVSRLLFLLCFLFFQFSGACVACAIDIEHVEVGSECGELARVHKRNEIVVTHLLELTAMCADEMAVWGVAGFFILHRQSLEHMPPDQPRLNHELQSVVERGAAHMVGLQLQTLCQLFDGEMRLKS